jgi:DNA-binding PadR family transcriptional regulator
MVGDVPDFYTLLNDARSLNSKVFSLARLEILSSLATLGRESVTYRELKTALGISDGALYSNLTALQKMGYVKLEKVKVENKELDSFRITPAGLEEWKTAMAWLKRLVGQVEKMGGIHV